MNYTEEQLKTMDDVVLVETLVRMSCQANLQHDTIQALKLETLRRLEHRRSRPKNE